MKPKLLDLCSGAGGASMGYHRAGFDVSTFAAAHASFPCQGFKKGTLWSDKPDLVTPGRELLLASGIPFVIENVMDAPLRRDRSIVLCADNMGLRTIRHRRFEYGGGLVLEQPPHVKHRARTAHTQRKKRWAEGWHASVTGDIGVYCGPEALGIDWMTGDELSEAIPPVYTEYVGRALLAHLTAERAA